MIKQTGKALYKPFRFVATVVILVFIFFEEIVLKPLRKVKVVILEKTIKRMSGYWTLGTLVILKTIEGLCKVVMPFAPNPTVVFLIVAVDGILGFISMNIIIHGRENIEEFPQYVRFAAWINRLKDDVKQTKIYQRAHTKMVEVKLVAKEWWGDTMLAIFGRRNPRGLVRYVKTAVRLRRRRRTLSQ